jgi:hypothetical protein
MRNIHRIPETIADLESQEFPNAKATAEKYDIGHKIFENRWKGKSIDGDMQYSQDRALVPESEQ